MVQQPSSFYKVLAPTALFGTVRVAKGDIVRRELLGAGVTKLVQLGVVEPFVRQPAVKRVSATLM